MSKKNWLDSHFSKTSKHLRAGGTMDTPVCIAGMDDQEDFTKVILQAKRNAMILQSDLPPVLVPLVKLGTGAYFPYPM
jgi:hypothetical protein